MNSEQGPLVAHMANLEKELSELRQADALHRIAGQHMKAHLMLTGENHRIDWINWVLPELKKSDVIGSPLSGYMTAEALSRTEEAIANVLRTGQAEEFEVHVTYPSESWYRVSAMPAGGEQKTVLLCAMDITQTKKTEATQPAVAVSYPVGGRPSLKDWIEYQADSRDLTKRERQLFTALVLEADKEQEDLAKALGISARTVKFHCKNVYQKFNVSNRLELLALMLRSE